MCFLSKLFSHCLILLIFILGSVYCQSSGKINRYDLVNRYNVINTKPDSLNSLTVGNGEFGFTVDVTGLQTFPAYYKNAMPLGTESQWGWHSFPNPNHYALKDVMRNYEVGGREIPYPDDHDFEGHGTPAGNWLRENPHRIDLARIGFVLIKGNGEKAGLKDLTDIKQILNLWKGEIESNFKLEGKPVFVKTLCNSNLDMISVHIESPLLFTGQIGIKISFSYGSGDWKNPDDWNSPSKHETKLIMDRNGCEFDRRLDKEKYYVKAGWSAGGKVVQDSVHYYRIVIKNKNSFDFNIVFSPKPIKNKMPDFLKSEKATNAYWKNYWTDGGIVDFTGSKDLRADELERRVILSQYLTAVNCAGSMPPQETGLVVNSWNGKSHLEMHWWHAVHFLLWGRSKLFERSFNWYKKIMPAARRTAELQGYKGVRWPKQVGPNGRETPSSIVDFLIWQQPHPIYYAELCYRNKPDRETLEKYKDIVFNTAEFMASYPVWDKQNKRYILGPALIPAQESYWKNRKNNINPTFELAYWYWGLETAQKWRLRLGLGRNKHWDKVMNKLSHPTIRDSVYAALETPPYVLPNDHPSMLMAYGFVPPTPVINKETMRKTLDYVLKTWDLKNCWGWDFPMMAMTAARLGEPEKAINILLMNSPKNKFLKNGQNFQELPALPLYLPGNGSLLAAIAMMVAGWDGAPKINAPGFPQNGSWKIRWEGLKKFP